MEKWGFFWQQNFRLEKNPKEYFVRKTNTNLKRKIKKTKYRKHIIYSANINFNMKTKALDMEKRFLILPGFQNHHFD